MSAGEQSFELELTAMAHGGSALGRHDGRTVFVPYTIPGERIEARITATKGRTVFAEGITLLDASADRVRPRCPHFGPHRCGRCQWQHIDYAAQLLLKQDVLADQLARIGGFDAVEVAPALPAPRQWGYNYHMTLRVEQGVPGFPAADGRATFPISECHILHPDLLDLYHAIDLDFDSLTRLKLQIDSESAAMLILSAADDRAPELHTDLPASVNMLLADNEPVNLIGASHARYTVRGRTFRVTAGSAFRANVEQLPQLIAAVEDALDLRGGEAVLDLYAGVGLFSAFMAESAGLVTMVESYPPAVTDADDNLAALDNVDVIEGAVEAVLPALNERYDAALIDPPPDGISVGAVDALAASGVRRVVYVSGDPAALARDGKRLARHGFRLARAQPIDLAPQTYYIDTVALFAR